MSSGRAFPRPPRPVRVVLLGLPILVLLLAAALLLAEAAARRLLSRPHLPHAAVAFEKGPYQVVVLNRGPRGVAVPARHATNRWGLRGEDPPRDWEEWDTWLALGSSTTLCYHLDESRTWTRRAEAGLRAARPRTWVGNAGQDGATSAGIRSLAEALLPEMRPKGVLLMAGGSDLVLSFYDDRRTRGSPYDRALLRRIARMREAGARDGGSFLASLKAGSRLLEERRARRRRLAVEVKTLDQAAHRSRFPQLLAAPEDPLPPLDTLLPSLPAFRDNLLRVGELARGLGIRAVFLTQPALYGTDSTWAAREARALRIGGGGYRISAATERHLLDRFNGEMLAVCAARGWECLDLAARIPPDSLLFYDEGHFTDSGAALAGDLLSGYLLGR